MPGRQEARRKTPKKRVKFLMKTAVFEHPKKGILFTGSSETGDFIQFSTVFLGVLRRAS